MPVQVRLVVESHGRGHRGDRLVRAVTGAQLDLVGLAVHGPRNAVDKVLRGATLHR